MGQERGAEDAWLLVIFIDGIIVVGDHILAAVSWDVQGGSYPLGLMARPSGGL